MISPGKNPNPSRTLPKERMTEFAGRITNGSTSLSSQWEVFRKPLVMRFLGIELLGIANVSSTPPSAFFGSPFKSQDKLWPQGGIWDTIKAFANMDVFLEVWLE
ncbi:hypothetical protein Tco_1395583 [Tanacetum coccineum]